MITKDKYITIPDFLIILKAMSEGTKTISDINRDTQITLSHLYNIKKILLNKGLITIVKIKLKEIDNSKRNIPTLTTKGKIIVKATNDILRELGIKEHNILDNLLTSKLKARNKTISKDVQNELDDLIRKGFQD